MDVVLFNQMLAAVMDAKVIDPTNVNAITRFNVIQDKTEIRIFSDTAA